MSVTIPDCIFCKIVTKEIPANLIYEDDQVIALKDIHPRAKVHLLLIPRIHVPSLAQLETKHEGLMSHMMLLLPNLAHRQDLHRGFRIIINTGKGGGQEIDHLHMHLLGGPQLPGF
ncbi:histidine triad (HIT) protein [Candidatus Nitrosoglobus terrae]|uniref:Histidine triad (HIT) protein n=1 Tax=Candidatus Nitrosoglobus terrae TaxID=1630141 RepID=A0A1Q2SJU9_9GAMM|nr:histidine triad nucleotide-binding protein [Candidatus Nitrosoglobus terrae]BAW79406.1 histidine triad (HIT) protein [Candidatus Nitrosoglobus terrae]